MYYCSCYYIFEVFEVLEFQIHTAVQLVNTEKT